MGASTSIPLPRPSGSRAEGRRAARWRRWMLLSIAGLATLVVVATVATFVVLRSLDAPWLKRRVEQAVLRSAGVEIDYGSARIDVLSGARLAGLVVRSPRSVRSFAPDLLRVDGVEARWSFASLLLGRAPLLQQITVQGVALTLVVDEHGRTSLDVLSPPAKSPPGPPVALSALPSKLLAKGLPVGRVDVEDVSLDLVRTDRGELADRTQVRGVAFSLVASTEEPGGARVALGAGSQTSPLDLTLDDTRAGRGRAKAWVTLAATSSALNLTLDLRVLGQTFAPSVSAERWLHAEASAQFDPARGRTEIQMTHAEAADGAATAEAVVEVADAGDVTVRQARGDIDFARLLGWLPAGVVPVTAERARLRYEVDSLVVGSTVHLSEGGAAMVEAELSNAAASGSAGLLRVGEGTLSIRAQAAADGGLSGQGELRFTRFESGGASPVAAQDGHVEVRARDVFLGGEDPLSMRGDATLSTEIGSLDVRSAGLRLLLDGVAVRVHTALSGHPPYVAELEAPVARLRVVGQDGRVLADAPARLQLEARDIEPDSARPVASRGAGHAALEIGDVRASLDATKTADAVDFAVDATAGSLRLLRAWVSGALADVPWARMAMRLRSTGRVQGLSLANPVLVQSTELDVDRPAFRDFSGRSVSIRLKSHGTALEHRADVDVRGQGVALGTAPAEDDHVTLALALDRRAPSLHIELGSEGHASCKLAASLAFMHARRALVYSLDMHLARLAPLGSLVPKSRATLDLTQLEAGLSAHGELLGVVAAVSPEGTFALQPAPLRTATVEGSADVRLGHLRWTQGDDAVLTPGLTWHADMHAQGLRRTIESHLDVGTVHFDVGNDDVDLNGIQDSATVHVTGSLENPEVEVTQHLSVHGVAQTLLPEVPLGDLALDLSADRSAEGVVHISDMKIGNVRGGTALAVTGNVDVGEGRHSLALSATLDQDLAPLSTVPNRFRGQGKVALEANVTSPDLASYRVRAAVKGSDVTVSLPREGIEVHAANGEVPVDVVLDMGSGGLALRRTEGRSPYSMLRFADQHPMLSRSGFLSIASVKTPFFSIAPLVGNLEVEQTVISLRQFEMGVRGGRITGQCSVDVDGAKSTLELHVRANGVQSSHGEPFDGNIAVAVSFADRTIDGRAEILRIGPRHLLDLLDMQDPLHVDPAINRIRSALAFGYPDKLRLVFDHGFASAHLELGGLAHLISIGELRGIPMGPLVDRMLAPVFQAQEAKETP